MGATGAVREPGKDLDRALDNPRVPHCPELRPHPQVPAALASRAAGTACLGADRSLGSPRRTRERPGSDSCLRCRPALHPQKLSPSARTSPYLSQGTKRRPRVPTAPASLTSCVCSSNPWAPPSRLAPATVLPCPRAAPDCASTLRLSRATAPRSQHGSRRPSARVRRSTAPGAGSFSAAAAAALRPQPPDVRRGGCRVVAGGGTRRPAQEGAATHCLACPALRLGDPLRLLLLGSQGLRHCARGGRAGRDSKRCHRELHSPGVPQECLPALRQDGFSGRAEGLPHAPVTGTKAGKPF